MKHVSSSELQPNRPAEGAHVQQSQQAYRKSSPVPIKVLQGLTWVSLASTTKPVVHCMEYGSYSNLVHCKHKGSHVEKLK
eukprot:scaffold29109_cov16-Tisochrysis_lutea.AAC.1